MRTDFLFLCHLDIVVGNAFINDRSVFQALGRHESGIHLTVLQRLQIDILSQDIPVEGDDVRAVQGVIDARQRKEDIPFFYIEEQIQAHDITAHDIQIQIDQGAFIRRVHFHGQGRSVQIRINLVHPISLNGTGQDQIPGITFTVPVRQL